ncbi:LPS translocon maturation chaperone LptM [Paraglaciecola polaris]|uniref:Lipoprotein n=1 Tax=Paraglaciecola polaris LMG 21857 TaxID=1129793 RepID=K7A1Q3_9ALTE|nr:lipoprotein [Paraglaciecola polaris]GAC34853.1 hypothetical protein GPLA_3974 [Paraglaciecola polaris LMG 21857]
MRRKTPFLLTLMSVVILLTLQGCGQKKPLFLPEKPQQNTSSQTPTLPSQDMQEGKQ